MFCYKDMTFCSFRDCVNFSQEKCHRAYTDDVHKEATAWANSSGLAYPPVTFFSAEPDCFEYNMSPDDAA